MWTVSFRLGLLFVFCISGCGKKPTKPRVGKPPVDSTTQSPGTTPPGGTGNTPPVTPPPSGHIPSSEVKKEFVYVFKYTGRRTCSSSATDVNMMIYDLHELGIPVYDSFATKDGSKKPEGCGKKTPDINVYRIDRSHLQLSEDQGGFCECKLKSEKTDSEKPVCVPYEYEIQPDCN